MKQQFCGQPVAGVPTTICMNRDGTAPAWTTMDYCGVLVLVALLAAGMWFYGGKK